MSFRSSLFVGIILTFLLNSCKSDIDVLAEWKETTIVYGLLNQADTAHYIRINKAFLGEGNALEMAQVFDSINYANSLSVKMDRYQNGNMIESYTLLEDHFVPKDPGMFANPNQVLFKLDTALDDNSEYRLNIVNTKTNNTVSAKTTLVHDFVIEKPNTSTTVSFTHPSAPHKVIWRSSENGRVYDFTLRFHYIEEDIVSTVQTNKYLDLYFGTVKSRNLSGGELLEIDFMGEYFYRAVSREISPNSDVVRHIGKLDYIFSVAADDFSTYMEVNTPSTGIVQEKPEYTNINNGFGIFSARYNKSIKNLSMAGPTKDSLRLGQFTKNLGFQ